MRKWEVIQKDFITEEWEAKVMEADRIVVTDNGELQGWSPGFERGDSILLWAFASGRWSFVKEVDS